MSPMDSCGSGPDDQPAEEPREVYGWVSVHPLPWRKVPGVILRALLWRLGRLWRRFAGRFAGPS